MGGGEERRGDGGVGGVSAPEETRNACGRGAAVATSRLVAAKRTMACHGVDIKHFYLYPVSVCTMLLPMGVTGR